MTYEAGKLYNTEKNRVTPDMKASKRRVYFFGIYVPKFGKAREEYFSWDKKSGRPTTVLASEVFGRLTTEAAPSLGGKRGETEGSDGG